MAGGEPRFGTTATYMRRHDHRATCLSIEIDRLHDRLYNEYQVFSAASVRKWSKFGLAQRSPGQTRLISNCHRRIVITSGAKRSGAAERSFGRDCLVARSAP